MLLTQYDEQAHIEYEKEISYEEGRADGEKNGEIKGAVGTYCECGIEKSDALGKLMDRFQLTEDVADAYIEKYWP